MDAIRWQRLETLFLQALESDAPGRHAALRRATRDDPSLYDEVRAMLAAHADAGRLAVEAQFIRDTSAAPADARADGAIGTRVGPWRLLEIIGRGGMGVVYRAERADGQYVQTAAVKLVRGELVTPELVARFRAERQILARLEHPAIARLLDGGITAGGVPYLVMEYVAGVAITDHCDTARLTVEQRLRLFRVVCAAVAHAHQNLVVHRDLKPSNILVSDTGAVKLLDFGIARLIAPGAAEHAVTRTMLPVLTPEYASPEQVQGGTITTATDVYALGLLLYELLSGERAQRTAGASLAAIQRAVCEQAPRPPSEATGAGAAADVAARAVARGHARGDRLRRELRGDLDTIVMTALRKDPARRYASVEQFVGDLDRHRAGLPVHARPDTFRYRAGKFLGRNRLAVAAAAAIAISVVSGMAVALAALDRAQRAGLAAAQEAATATQVSDFLVDLFRASDPAEARGDTVTARQLLDRGALRVHTQLTDQPEIQARLLRTMAQAYAELGLFSAAIPLVEEELRIHDARAGGVPAQHGAALAVLSGLVGRTGDYERSRALAHAAVTMHERDGVAHSRALVDALNALGSASGRLGDLPAARAALERSLAMGERLFGPADPAIAGTLNNLAIVHWMEGDAAGAVPYFERAIAIHEREHGPDHPALAHTLNNLALAHNRSGARDRAIAVHERALALRERILAPDHPDIAESLNNLAVVLLATEQYAAARPLLERALAIREAAFHDDHEHVATTRNNLGSVLLGLGDPAAARPLFERALASLDPGGGRDAMTATFPLLGLARADHALGDHDAAERRFRRVIEVRTARGGVDHPELVPALRHHAACLRARGRVAEADAQDARAERIASVRGVDGG